MKLSLHRSLLFLFSLLSASTWAQAPSAGIVWARQIKGQYEATILKMEIDPTGNMIVAGNFIDIADFDMGPGQHLKSAGAYQDFYVAKYTPYGSLKWISTFDGSGVNDQLLDLLVHPNGMVSVTGFFNIDLDADPGPGQTLLTGSDDICLITLDNQGQLLAANTWAVDNNGPQKVASCLTPSGNIILMGMDLGSFDLDPSSGVQLMTSVPANSSGGFLIEMTPAGTLARALDFPWGNSNNNSINHVVVSGTNLVFSGEFSSTLDNDLGAWYSPVTATNRTAYVGWYDLATMTFVNWRQLGAGALSTSKSLHADNFGNILWGVSFQGSADIDTDPAVTNIVPAVWGVDAVLYAFGGTGSALWYNLMAGNGNDEISEIDSDPAGNIYIGGTLHGTLDFDGSTIIYNLTASGNRDAYIASYGANGQFIWAQKAGTANDDYGHAIDLDPNGNVYLSGKFIGSGDFDPGTSTYGMLSSGTYDAFIGKYAQGACGNFGAYASVVNAIPCGGTGNSTIAATGGSAPYTYLWDDGSTSNNLITTTFGIRHVTISDAAGCSINRMMYIQGPTAQSQYDLEFAVQPQIFRPNVVGTTNFTFRNSGCTNVNAVACIKVDTALYDIITSVAPTSIIGNAYYFSLPNLVYNGGAAVVSIQSRTSIHAVIGQKILFDVSVTPDTGDFNPANNARVVDFDVPVAIDPNDKQVFPRGDCHQKYVDKDEILTYMVRFQNTGNAEAYNIYVLDSLDPSFDLSTLRVVENSHPMITEIMPGNVLKFRYDNIMLPDSHSNEAASHGHVVYTIKATTGTADLTTVHNRGDIYFDWNAPVLTNTTHNTLIEVVPACSTTTGVDQAVGSMSIFPNPSQGSFSVSAEGLQQVEVFSLSGQLIFSQIAISGTANVQLPAHTAAGLYLLKGQSEKGISVQRILVE